MSETKTLQQWLPYKAIDELDPKVGSLLGCPVEFSIDGREVGWPGKHKNVVAWCVIRVGENRFKAVGWNENVARGWSFPAIGISPSDALIYSRFAAKRGENVESPPNQGCWQDAIRRHHAYRLTLELEVAATPDLEPQDRYLLTDPVETEERVKAQGLAYLQTGLFRACRISYMATRHSSWYLGELILKGESWAT